MPIKNVQTLKPRNTTVRYRRANGKFMNAYVTATNGAGGVVTLRVPHTRQTLTTKSKLSSLHGTDGYDNRH